MFVQLVDGIKSYIALPVAYYLINIDVLFSPGSLYLFIISILYISSTNRVYPGVEFFNILNILNFPKFLLMWNAKVSNRRKASKC